MNSIEIFSIALGLSNPWYVEKVEFLDSAESLSKEFICIQTLIVAIGSDAASTAYDTVDRVWPYLNFFQHSCFLHARVLCVKNSEGEIHQGSVPWICPGMGFTLLFEAYAMLLIESGMPVNKMSSCMNVTVPRLWRVFDYRIERAVSGDDLSTVTEVGMYETSHKKRHNCVTVFADLSTRRVIHACKSRDTPTVESFVQFLEEKGGKKENMEVVSMDMTPTFISGVMESLPDACMVFDRCHLVQSLNNALDDVRKGNDLLKGYKYAVLKKYGKLSRNKKSELDYVLMMYPTLGEAYRLWELFMDMFSVVKPEEAKGYL
jgi:transposase